MNQPPAFNALLEKYVFAMAAQLIDQVSQEEQTQLINLLHSIDTTPPEPVESATRVAESPIQELEDQWQQALSPLPRKARSPLPYTEERKALVARSLASNQIQIETTRLLIGRLDALIRRAEETITRQRAKTHVLTRYQRLRAHYVARLDQLNGFALTSARPPER